MRFAFHLDGCRFAASIARFAARILACAAAVSAQPALSQEVKLNEVLRSLFYAPQYVALRIGAFEQEGLKIAARPALRC